MIQKVREEKEKKERAQKKLLDFDPQQKAKKLHAKYLREIKEIEYSEKDAQRFSDSKWFRQLQERKHWIAKEIASKSHAFHNYRIHDVATNGKDILLHLRDPQGKVYKKHLLPYHLVV